MVIVMRSLKGKFICTIKPMSLGAPDVAEGGADPITLGRRKPTIDLPAVLAKLITRKISANPH